MTTIPFSLNNVTFNYDSIEKPATENKLDQLAPLSRQLHILRFTAIDTLQEIDILSFQLRMYDKASDHIH